MIFKGDNSKPEMIFQVHPRLAMIMFFVEDWLQKIGKEATWTSIIRPKLEDTGIHELKRAADMSVKNLSLKESLDLLYELNDRFIYDKFRNRINTALLNDGHTYNKEPSAKHIHIQVNV